MEALKIRAAEPAGFHAAMDFYNGLIDAMADAPYHPGWEKGVYPTEAFIRTSIQQGELFLALLDGAIAGAMVINHQCTPGYETIAWGVRAEAAEVSVIHALGTAPARQGKGLAREMVREAISLARERGQKAIRLDVLSGNVPAQKLYTGAGFQYRDTIKLFYEDTGLTDFLLYELVL